jgi:hypothetical protein
VSNASSNPKPGNMLLVHAGDRILPSFQEDRSNAAKKRLEALGVEILLPHVVDHVDQDGVTESEGDCMRPTPRKGTKPSPDCALVQVFKEQRTELYCLAYLITGDRERSVQAFSHALNYGEMNPTFRSFHAFLGSQTGSYRGCEFSPSADAGVSIARHCRAPELGRETESR